MNVLNEQYQRATIAALMADRNIWNRAEARRFIADGTVPEDKEALDDQG